MNEWLSKWMNVSSSFRIYWHKCTTSIWKRLILFVAVSSSWRTENKAQVTKLKTPVHKSVAGDSSGSCTHDLCRSLRPLDTFDIVWHVYKKIQFFTCTIWIVLYFTIGVATKRISLFKMYVHLYQYVLKIELIYNNTGTVLYLKLHYILKQCIFNKS